MTTKFTPEQMTAISLMGSNILVSAAAGSGKTSVLVERVIRLVLGHEENGRDGVVDVDRLLVVTFTEKAAQEMKERLRAALLSRKNETYDERIDRQIRLLEKAQISTIHSFCLKVLRRYFYRAGLDPSFKVLDPNEAELLRLDALEDTFEAMYQSEDMGGDLFRGLVRRYGGRGMDQGLRDIVLSLHDFASTQEDPSLWLKNAVPDFRNIQDIQTLPWMKVLVKSAGSQLRRAETLILRALELLALPCGPKHYEEALRADLDFYRNMSRSLLTQEFDEGLIHSLSSFSPTSLPRKKCTSSEEQEIRDSVQNLRKKAKGYLEKVRKYPFLRPVQEVLREESENAQYLGCLAHLVQLLDQKYTALKKERCGVDFDDLERLCLKVLRDDNGSIAKTISQEYDYVFVDEYQDTNPLQDLILTSVSQQISGGNLFMVGDIKQSIYRFRLAEPEIFLKKYRSYSGVGSAPITDSFKGVESGIKIDLSKNFRSRQSVVDTVNYVFSSIMHQDTADIEYDDGHSLIKGALFDEEDKEYKTQMHLVERANELSLDETGGSESQFDEYDAIEKEALVVASKITELVSVSKRFKYKDIAILLRATKNRANAVAQVLERWDIPVYADTGSGYFQAREVEVVLALLSVIDNPRQDIPLAAVLRSPIVGLSPADLADIRAGARRDEFYDAVTRYAKGDKEPQKKVSEFLESLDNWRTLARRRPLGEMIWKVLRETGYHDFVGGLPGGAARQANVRALCSRAHQFDSFGHHGLYRFLRFIEKLRESDSDLGTARSLGEEEDVVRVMSIHKAKGLEFPVVFIMDLGKEFNTNDLKRDILYHRWLGLGGVYCDIDKGIKYPSLSYKAIATKIAEENLAEEMRVLYVGMTRAKERLYLVGSVRGLDKSLKEWELDLSDPGSARTPLDWLGPLLVNDESPFEVVHWNTEDGNSLPTPQHKKTVFNKDSQWEKVRRLEIPDDPVGQVYDEVVRRLKWDYPWRGSTAIPGKMSVGEVKRRLDPEDQEVRSYLPSPRGWLGMDDSKHYVSALERGIAVHALLAGMRLEPEVLTSLEREVDRLSAMGYLAKDDLSVYDLAQVQEFLGTSTGQILISQREKVRREVPFTMSIPAFWAARGHWAQSGINDEDFVVVQGIIDALIEEEDGFTIIDYKTDDITEAILPQVVASYTPQVALYARAVRAIMKKHVKRACLVFLALGREVDVDWEAYLESVERLTFARGRLVP